MGIPTIGGGLLSGKRNSSPLRCIYPYAHYKETDSLAGSTKRCSVASTFAVMKHLGLEDTGRSLKGVWNDRQACGRETRELGVEPLMSL